MLPVYPSFLKIATETLPPSSALFQPEHGGGDIIRAAGLLCAGWVAKQVELSAAAGDAPEKLAETLVQTARIRAQKTGRPDDITAAVLRDRKSVV